MNAIVFAFRNLGRNLRRSLVTILSISLGFAAVALFAGYTLMVYKGLEDQAIYGEMIGHLTVEKASFAKEGRLSPDKSLFTAREIAALQAEIHRQVPDAFVASRLGISGMLSNGQVSTIFIAEGIDPADMKTLRGPRRFASGMLKEDAQNSATVSRGLAEILSLNEGSDASVLVSTIHGQANASDLVVSDVFVTGNAGTEDKFMYVPLSLARSLYDADERADRLTILSPSADSLEEQRVALLQALNGAGFQVKISTWQELSSFYRQVKSMFDMIFGFLLVIVITIVVMSITNAMSMSVVERTKEIGTLRAIGMRRSGIVRLFAAEAVLLVALGCAIGLLLTLAVRYGVHALDISYQPPNSTDRVPLLIGLDIGKSAIAASMLSLLGVLAAYVPAWRAARNPIIDSLAHT
ncbi:ABC transporter permease [Sulfuritalea sp.]|uniref:ABC transporter permease n=1 Tax=Sulfuritalea sp. TaxID=2480090 RepID=UPI00286DADE5|nr:FtsX-like permease family protein [Sulfuritalea sp.]